MEGSLQHDRAALLAAFRGFNRWLLDDWTFNYHERLYAAPYLTLVDVDWAVSPISDTVASFLADGIFLRFPNIRLASVENGADWVRPLFGKLDKAFKMRGPMWKEDPRETFRRHVWVSPFYEDDLADLRELVGAEHLLFGSDWPHAEGLADPLSYVEDLDDAGFDQADLEKVMYANAASLVQPAA